jgi:hypothetical protein
MTLPNEEGDIVAADGALSSVLMIRRTAEATDVPPPESDTDRTPCD